MNGVQDDVAQVSITSVSGINSLPQHAGHVVREGLSSVGSMGRVFVSAGIISPHPLQNQIGKGTP